MLLVVASVIVAEAMVALGVGLRCLSVAWTASTLDCDIDGVGGTMSGCTDVSCAFEVDTSAVGVCSMASGAPA